MRRREFITLLGGAAARPLRRARARSSRAMPVIGYFSQGPRGGGAIRTQFLKGLETIGLRGGRNVAIEYRFAKAMRNVCR